jgi:hypothetical protein
LFQVLGQTLAFCFSPLSLDWPAFEFRESHEGDDERAADQVGFVKRRGGMALE